MFTCNSSRAWLKVKQQQATCEPWKESNGAMPVDDSLTNLQWLQEFSFLTTDPQKAAGPQRLLQGSYAPASAPASPPAGDTAATGMPPTMGKPTSSSSLQPLAPALDAADYKTNAQLKPPYSYATLICMAMQASKEAKLTLSAIYAWITENFCYYRHAEPSWQNSIRHNLSLNKCFKKVPRRKDEPGKGGFWQIDPRYADMFVNGVFRRRRMPALSAACSPPAPPMPASKARQGPSRVTEPRCPQQERTVGLLSGHRPPLSKHKQRPATSTGQEAWPGLPSPLTPAGGDAAALPEDLAWTTVLEDPFAGSLADVELNTALSSLAADEDLTPQSPSPPLGALSKGSPISPVTTLGEDIALCPEPLSQPWEEAATEPPLSPAWAFEEGACFSEGFLAEIQPWEV